MSQLCSPVGKACAVVFTVCAGQPAKLASILKGFSVKANMQTFESDPQSPVMSHCLGNNGAVKSPHIDGKCMAGVQNYSVFGGCFLSLPHFYVYLALPTTDTYLQAALISPASWLLHVAHYVSFLVPESTLLGSWLGTSEDQYILCWEQGCCWLLWTPLLGGWSPLQKLSGGGVGGGRVPYGKIYQVAVYCSSSDMQ